MDPFWRMPLWEGYAKMLESKIADVNSAPDNGFAGAITAALFLQKVRQGRGAVGSLIFLLGMPDDKPGRPQGGEGFHFPRHLLLRARYGSHSQSSRVSST